jgi:opacity protein-like surface antigen
MAVHTSSPLDENMRCPLQLYAGAGPGIFFAETSNQFGRSTDNGRLDLNALAGAKYFLARNVAMYAEYKFNYAHSDFSQAQGEPCGWRFSAAFLISCRAFTHPSIE